MNFVPAVTPNCLTLFIFIDLFLEYSLTNLSILFCNISEFLPNSSFHKISFIRNDFVRPIGASILKYS